ncbi:MAG: protein kinase [Polyangiaceae bacterium]
MSAPGQPPNAPGGQGLPPFGPPPATGASPRPAITGAHGTITASQLSGGYPQPTPSGAYSTAGPFSAAHAAYNAGPVPAVTNPPYAPAVTAPPISAAPTSDVSPPPVTGPDPLIGQTLDSRYVVEAAIGEGGMGVVYRGRHRLIERKVALKVLKGEYVKDKEIVERFILEAKTASGIGNPHIIDILDFGVLPDGCTYFAMEFLEGRALMDVILEGKIPPARVIDIGIQVCDGLSAAHARSIVHRDLKPDNIFLLPRGGGDFVKILDFGIAKVARDANKTKLTQAGAVFGTPHYMSPEQAAGTTVDHRADIYALGVILYEMTAGQLPFDADNMMGILTQHMYKQPVPIRALPGNADCPAGLEAVIQKCLEKRATARYQTVDDLAEDLKRLKVGSTPEAIGDLMARAKQGSVPVDYFKSPNSAPSSRLTQQKSSRGWIFGLAAALFVGASALGIFLVWQSRQTHAANQDSKAAPETTPAPPPVTATATATTPPTAITAAAPIMESSSAVVVDATSAAPVASSGTFVNTVRPTTAQRPTTSAKSTGSGKRLPPVPKLFDDQTKSK